MPSAATGSRDAGRPPSSSSTTRGTLEEAGAFAIVIEMVPADVAEQVTKALRIPTIGIGAGPHCDAQVLVWPDMAGLRGGKMAKFVKQYADLRGTLLAAARTYAAEVSDGTFPSAEQSFD